MKTLGELPRRLHSYDTCRHNGRLFSFRPEPADPEAGKLYRVIVSEIRVGDTLETVEADTGLLTDGMLMGCCEVGRRILLLGGKDSIDLAAKVSVAREGLSSDALRVTKLSLVGETVAMNVPCLWATSKAEAMLTVLGQNRLWRCELGHEKMAIRPVRTRPPEGAGFGSVPVRLPSGLWLAAGGLPYSRDITVFNAEGDPAFSRVGSMPGKSGCGTSVALLRGRFVVGFGGGWSSEMWVLDTATGGCSGVRREGSWHPDSEFVFLECAGGELRILGGNDNNCVSVLSLAALGPLIEDPEVRRAFAAAG